MPSPKIPSQLANYSRLNSCVWYHQSTSNSTKDNAPDLVLLVGWMDATPRHLSKYTAGYETLYPSAGILFITNSAVDMTMPSEAAKSKRVEPVLEILRGLSEGTKVLVHLFSNGGALTSARIATAYKKRTGRVLPMSALVLDSSPGRATYERTVRAFAVGLPKNWILRFLGTMMFRFVFGLYILSYWVLRRSDLVDEMRRTLNDKTIFDEDAPRMYIYSVADPMVDWRLVEEHSEQAKDLGYSIDLEKYLESGHCGHLIIDVDRYWKTIQRLWDIVS